MSDYIQVDHGRIVTDDVLEKPERHLTLVASENWPTEADIDPYESKCNRRNPVGVAVILTLACLAAYIGLVGWAAVPG